MVNDEPAVAPAAEQGRDYLQVLEGLDKAIEILAREGSQEDALRDSFESAAAGFGAKKALLLLVEQPAPLRLRNIHVRGLTPQQVAACEHAESVPGVSATMIREALERAEPLLRLHPLETSGADRTASYREGSYSAICAPVFDPITAAPLAALYFQNQALTDAYREPALQWLRVYAKAIGRVFGVFLQQKRREQELAELLEGRSVHLGLDLVGDSSHTQALRRELHEHYIEAAELLRPMPVLITGEKGTGKEQVAQYIHAFSARRNKPFVVVNCPVLSKELAAGELFGAKRGSYTGATTDRIGYLQAAHGGVLFIDEIQDLGLEVQAMLKRALDRFTVTPLGSHQEVPFDAYVILATNEDLPRLVAERRFLGDLYDRFATQTIRLVPLRERSLDIKPLAEHFLSEFARRTRKPTLGFTDEAMRILMGHAWPGNVRQLRLVVEALVTRAKRGELIGRELFERAFPDLLQAPPAGAPVSTLWGGTLEDGTNAFRRELILTRLAQYSGPGRRRRARESLGLPHRTFYRYLSLYAINTLDRRVAVNGARPDADDSDDEPPSHAAPGGAGEES